MRTAAWEMAHQIAVRGCSREMGGEIQNRHDFGKYAGQAIKLVYFLGSFFWSGDTSARLEKTVITMMDFNAILGIRRYKKWAHKTSS